MIINLYSVKYKSYLPFTICLFVNILFTWVAIAQPKIDSFTPLSGPIGTQVSISGSGFSTNATQNIVYFGSVRAQIVSALPGMLKVTVPAGASNSPITVTAGGLTAYSKTGFFTTFAMEERNLTPMSFGGNLDILVNSKQEYATGFLTSADLDIDGKPDIIVSNANDLQMTILHNLSSPGKLSFDTTILPVPSRYTNKFSTGDLDGDGKLDIVCTYESDLHYIGILRNTSVPGKISFASAINLPTDTIYRDATINDIDGDGKPDLLVYEYNVKKLLIYRNMSIGSNLQFSTPVKIDNFDGFDYVNSDFNNDGLPDLMISKVEADSISTYINKSTPGNISFNRSTVFSFHYPFILSVADLNADGKNDFVSTLGNDQIRVFQNTTPTGGDLSFLYSDYNKGAFQYFGIGSSEDLNGDGKADLFSLGYYEGFGVFENNSQGTQLSFKNFNLLYQDRYTALGFAGDFDLDGKPDICFGKSNEGFVTLKRNRMGEAAIKDFSPVQGAAGDTITIHGVKLNTVTGVNIGGLAAKSFTIIDSSLIKAVVQNASYQSNKVVISTTATTDSATGFQYKGPRIKSFSPAIALMGDVVQIFGVNLTGTFSVKFGNTDAKNIQVNSDTLITVVVDTGSTGSIQLSTLKGSDELPGFKFQLPAVIDSFFPAAAFANSEVTIKGKNLLATTEVWFGDVPAPFLIVNDSLIVANVAEGASGNVTLFSGTYKSSIPGFTYITTCEWTGAIDSSWENSSNWSCGSIPGEGTRVVINTGSIVVSSNTTIWSLSLGNDASLLVNAPAVVTILH